MAKLLAGNSGHASWEACTTKLNPPVIDRPILSGCISDEFDGPVQVVELLTVARATGKRGAFAAVICERLHHS